MVLHWRTFRPSIGLLAAAGILLTASGHPSAQTSVPGGSGALLGGASDDDEVGPRLLAGPKGEVLRLWQRRADERKGGGAVILALSSKEKAQTLVELRSPEPGVSFRDPELSVSPSQDLALLYRSWRHHPRAKQLFLARSSDAGKTWSQAPAPIDSSGKSFDPGIAWSSDKNLVVVWADERRGARQFDVYARRSSDGGATWEPEQLLSRFPETIRGDLFARPQLISDGQDRLWAVWVGYTKGRSSLYMNRSTDGGRKWTDPVALTGDSRSVYAHRLRRAGDRLLLVWQDVRTGRDRIYGVASSDRGETWTSPTRIDHLAANAGVAATAPTVLLGPDGEALVAWQDARNGREDIFLARSTDGGRTWGSEDQRMDMDEAGTALSRHPQIERAADGRVGLAWEDDRAGLEDVYLRVRSAGERPTWGPEIRVSLPSPKRAARMPQLLWGADGSLHLAWEVWDQTLGSGNMTKSVDGKSLRIEGR